MQSGAGRTFDVIVVGSGASGGWAAKRLAEAGVKVGLLDAGRALTDADYKEHQPAADLAYRNRAPEVIRRTRPVQKDCYACSEWNYDWFRNDLEEPYTTAKGTKFSWQGRMQVVGGRTNVWGRQSYRFSDLDFKSASHDGFGDDWPLGYDDVAPYYDLEDYVGITGLSEGVYELPDGRFHPPMGLRCVERQFKTRVKDKLGWTMTLGRSANLTKAVNGRQPCHYCGPCERGCVTHSYFNSAFTTVADALKTGHCTLVTNAMGYKVLMDPVKHRARGVLYVDRVTREPKEVYARAVVLCAQALESTRILLNSAGEQDPAGLANSSGVLGHYLMDHLWVAGGATGEFPDLAAKEKPSVDGPNRPDGTYVIRFRNTKAGPKAKDFLRGYGFQGGGSTSFNWNAPGFGGEFKRSILDPVVSMGLAGFGECLPYYENYVEIEPNVVDVFGIPVLRINMQFRDNEKKMIPDMMESAAEMMAAAGAKSIRPWMALDRDPGWGIHEMGVARMGTDPKRSVVNAWHQAHDLKNLFIVDGSSFTTSAAVNPTSTIGALALRCADGIWARRREWA